MLKWLIIITLIILGAGYFAYNDPSYRSYFSYFNQYTDKIMPTSVTHTTTYRWQDKKGQWQLSDKPPAKGIQYETVEYHKNTNVIPTEQLTGQKK